MISTFAGDPNNKGNEGYSGDGGPALGAALAWPSGVAFDPAGNLYIADNDNSVIRKVDAGTKLISTIAGKYNEQNGDYSGDGGPATAAQLSWPMTIALGPDGSLYIADSDNSLIRKVGPQGIVQFDSQDTGTSSAAQDVIVSNIGNAPLVFSAIALTNAALDSSVTTCLVSTPVAPGASCVLGIQFAPQAPGSRLAGSAVLTDNAPNSPQTINLARHRHRQGGADRNLHGGSGRRR